MVVFDTRNEFYTYIATRRDHDDFSMSENIGMNIGLLPITGIPAIYISGAPHFRKYDGNRFDYVHEI